MSALPSGAVTLLFTDVEGSTRLTTVRMGLHASPPPGEEESLPEETFRAMPPKVERAGLEPATPSLQSWCSPN